MNETSTIKHEDAESMDTTNTNDQSPVNAQVAVYHKINKTNANEFVESFKDSKQVDLSDLNEFDSAGLQALLALNASGVKVIKLKDELLEKISLAGGSILD